ncbi:hypothetical protein Lfu02_02990 [Longispora fulva]|uniref:Secreted protein n=1 Tax=Longispora fulva TaxID=619741 RepID=A0A8J7KI50_9ACTN|nr:hypothetical protein [Longispora fulva]MBG6135829.1 hypothetical protein [Longispora fulva]GIG55927.1 hypothetical protein Lfu02_02990 [Longispora fulva]
MKLTSRTSTPRRLLATAAVAVAVAAGIVGGGAAPASAGSNGCIWIGPSDGSGNIRFQQECGVSGTYHMDVWGAGHSRTSTGGYYYNGGTVISGVKWGISSGQTVCAELWYHKPSGGYESQGLPCWTRP